jgi:hypothetical protein
VILQLGKQAIDLRPFVWAALGWAVGGIALLFFFSNDQANALRSFALYFVLALADLFFIVKTVAAVLVLMSDQGAKNRTAYAIQAFVFGGLKLLCLGMIGFCLIKFPGRVSGGILFGLGALVAVPLLGGFLWSQRVLKETPPDEKRAEH